MISYDTNVLIYALEGVGPLTKAAQDCILQGERDGAILTVLAWQELLTGAILRQGEEAAARLNAALEGLRTTKFIPVTMSICRRAADLTGQFGRQVYGYDAIHLATALEYKASVFLTNDKALLSLKIAGLNIRALDAT